MLREERAKRKILYVETVEISLLDIPRSLDEMGYDVYRGHMGIHAQEYVQQECDKLISAIDNLGIHYAISYDFVESLSQACFETGIPYICWVYDAPQKELYTYRALYPCNYVFVFDKLQRERLLNIGLKNVYHIPLAIHPEKVAMSLKGVTREYENDITLVGQLYNVDDTENALQYANELVKEEIAQCIDHCYLKWDDSVRLHGSLGENAVKHFVKIDRIDEKKAYPLMTEQFFYEAAVISRMLAHKERTAILNELAEKYDVKFYTRDSRTDRLSAKVKIMPPVAYDTEISALYHKSKINLNITLHCIETGASQRIFDVMAAGGFLISNYQKELEELFVPGEEIVLYHNMQELKELVDYYMTHDAQRAQIAARGREKVLKYHTYETRLDEIVEQVESVEAPRMESYISLQRKELRELAEDCLKDGSDVAIEKMYEVFVQPTNATTIKRTSDLSVLREMLESWICEREVNKTCIFKDVKSVEQAEMKYNLVKHSLWRIEQGLSEEKCLQAMNILSDANVSIFFIGYSIIANMQFREELLSLLADVFRESDAAKAVGLLEYGLHFLPGSNPLLMAKANTLLEMQAWQAALDTLEQIENPSSEVVNLISELRDALGEM